MKMWDVIWIFIISIIIIMFFIIYSIVWWCMVHFKSNFNGLAFFFLVFLRVKELLIEVMVTVGQAMKTWIFELASLEAIFCCYQDAMKSLFCLLILNLLIQPSIILIWDKHKLLWCKYDIMESMRNMMQQIQWYWDICVMSGTQNPPPT